MTQEVAYNGLLVERRKLLHERAGQALESMFAEQLNDHADKLVPSLVRGSRRGREITKSKDSLAERGEFELSGDFTIGQ